MIRNREIIRQTINFTGLKYGSITPTNIDLAIDFDGRVAVFTEYKYKNSRMPYGQKRALITFADGLQKSGIETIIIHASHSNLINEDIDGANAIVKKIYYKKKWYNRKGTTVKEEIDLFLKYCKINI